MEDGVLRQLERDVGCCRLGNGSYMCWLGSLGGAAGLADVDWSSGATGYHEDAAVELLRLPNGGRSRWQGRHEGFAVDTQSGREKKRERERRREKRWQNGCVGRGSRGMWPH